MTDQRWIPGETDIIPECWCWVKGDREGHVIQQHNRNCPQHGDNGTIVGKNFNTLRGR